MAICDFAPVMNDVLLPNRPWFDGLNSFDGLDGSDGHCGLDDNGGFALKMELKKVSCPTYFMLSST
mgnify:CR=1 FL=1